MLDVIRLLQQDELFPRYKELVRTSERDGLVLLNYSTRCQYANAWDAVTTVCRGLIVDTRDWSVAARPFDKFFNVGEHPSTRRENLPDGPFEVFEKIDGTFGAMYRDRAGDPWLATRGSFDGPQALRGTEMLRQLRLDALPDGYTPIFEIVYPNQHVSNADSFAFSVIRYDYEDLALLGLRHRETGDELSWEETSDVAGRIGARLPKTLAFDSFDEVQAAAKDLPKDQEGFVARFRNGLRVKLKGRAYLALNALIWDLSDQRIRDALVDGTYDDLIQSVPEEIRAQAEQAAARYIAAAREVELDVEAYLRNAPTMTDRKIFATWVNQRVPARLRGAMFQRFDGKQPNWHKIARDGR